MRGNRLTGRPRRGILLVAAASVVAIAAVACAPPAPAPAPVRPDRGARGRPAATPAPPPPPPNPCDVSTSSLAAGSAQQYAAVVRNGYDEHVETRSISSNAEKRQFEDDLNATGEVLALSPDTESVHALAQTPTWGFTSVHYTNAWTVAPATKGAGIRVAVIDTGVDASHADLSGRVVPGQDFVNSALNGTTDCNGHGTHVSGILAADDNSIGVVGGAPEATIVSVRVLDKTGSGTSSAVANGILWASDPTKGNAKVISLSLGLSQDNSVLRAAVATAISRGVVVIAAAGNDNGPAPEYPAAYPGVLAVAALSNPPNPHRHTKLGFRSVPTSLNHAPNGVDAPGVSINSTWNNVRPTPSSAARRWPHRSWRRWRPSFGRIARTTRRPTWWPRFARRQAISGRRAPMPRTAMARSTRTRRSRWPARRRSHPPGAGAPAGSLRSLGTSRPRRPPQQRQVEPLQRTDRCVVGRGPAPVLDHRDHRRLRPGSRRAGRPPR